MAIQHERGRGLFEFHTPPDESVALAPAPKRPQVIRYAFSDEQREEIRQENLLFISELAESQDPETLESARRKMTKFPNRLLIDIYSAPTGSPPLSEPTTKPDYTFRHPQTRYIP